MEEGRFASARDLMPIDVTGNGAADFWQMMSRLTDRQITLGKSRTEGTAGSLYISVPVKIAGITPTGDPISLWGEVVLKRVNDFRGSSERNLTWHFESANFDRMP